MADIIDVADELYRAHDWAAALEAYRLLADHDPETAVRGALPMAIGHCLIELADGDPDGIAAYYGKRVSPDVQARRVVELRVRAVELARAGDFARTSRLLRFACGYDGLLAQIYADGMINGRTVCCGIPDAPPSEAPPPFLAHLRTDAAMIAGHKARAAGQRLLVATRRSYAHDPARQYEFYDNVERTARDFGFTVSLFDTHAVPAGQSPELFATTLQGAIIDVRPDLIFYDELFYSGLSSQAGMSEQVALVLQSAREVLGTRVIKGFPDAWTVPGAEVYRGLGTAVDLVHHMHPTILGRASDAERAATVCLPWPHRLPAPTVPAGTVPRAAFAGSVHYGSIPRLFWWAELGRLGLPFDFHETNHASADQRTDQDYADLLRRYQVSVSLTRRSSGIGILCGRTIDIPIAGSCLLEEDCLDTRHFLTPGAHYLPFRTIADLADLMPRLLRDHAYRERLTAAGQAWVTKYFTGDYFWSEVLARLGTPAA